MRKFSIRSEDLINDYLFMLNLAKNIGNEKMAEEAKKTLEKIVRIQQLTNKNRKIIKQVKDTIEFGNGWEWGDEI